MKRRKEINKNIYWRRFRNNIKRKRKKKTKKRKQHFKNIQLNSFFDNKITYQNILNKWLPVNLRFLLTNEKCDFYLNKLEYRTHKKYYKFIIPNVFSIVDNPTECFLFLKDVIGALIFQHYQVVVLDYGNCERLDLNAQVLLDIVLKDIITFYKRCAQYKKTTPRIKRIGGDNFKNIHVTKLLFSVGSPAIHSKREMVFDDIIPYKLCIHDREKNIDPVKVREQKDIDTTNLAEYVIKCLERLKRTLTPERIDNLCTVIGEILINAEEHSTTKYRFSIGYFHEINDGRHYGVFRLVILNFGKTIYEKFKDPDCPNKEIVDKMTRLSKDYTKKKLFFKKGFEEETLWTLYALQEGVTSISPDKYKKRGNGSIRFIENFFNIKGVNSNADDISRMTIISGNTRIIFDGTYNIKEKMIGDESFKVMTFNQSGNIEDKPDSKYVTFVENYFPGTLISAKILFNEDDFQYATQQ